MEQFILQLGSMSMQAVVVILVVLLVRAAFAGAKVPKKYATWLWMVPYIIMICPWKISSVFSFWRMPKRYQMDRIQAGANKVQQAVTQMVTGTMSGEGIGNHEMAVISGESTPGSGLNMAESEALVNGLTNSANAEFVAGVSGGADNAWSAIDIIALIWLLGVVALIIYSVVSYIKLRRKILCSIQVEANIYRADDISTAFVLGVLRPKIYIPSALRGENITYVLEHEKTHIKRLDPLKKICAFGITSVHWFNPLAWVAFYFFCKDMEMACDEETIARIGMEKKQEYAMALLQLSSAKKMLAGAPLAFGEDNVKDRVRNIARYKKVWVAVSVLAVVVIVILAAGFLSKYEDTTTLGKRKEEVGIIEWSEKEEAIILSINGEVTDFPEAYYDSFAEFFEKLEVSKEPISLSRDENRPKEVVLRVGGSDYIYIGNDYKEIWFNDGVKPSLSYEIINPQEVIDFLKLQEGSVGEAKQQETSEAPEPEIEPVQKESEVYPWEDLDGDGTDEYVLIERGDFGGQNSVNGRLTVFVNNEPVYQYTEELWIVCVDAMEYLDLDGDGKEEIFVSFMPSVNSMPLEEWFVLKEVDGGWERLEMYHYGDDMVDNGFPITVVLEERDFDFVIRLEGWEGEIAFDATEHYERRKAELEEGNGAYEAFMEGPYVEGSVVGSPLAWGVWNIQTGTYGGNNCLIAEHGLGGPGGKYDYYGNAYVYFNYDEHGKIKILHMEFVPTDF